MTDVYLLDTHVLLWAVIEPDRLAPAIRSLIEDNRYAVSIASLWELINKRGKADAPLKQPAIWWEQYVTRMKTSVLQIRTPHVVYLERLENHHKDPYDRILMAQSVIEGMPLVTSDRDIRKYAIDQRSA
jgi:PIN domain nuclease of toxin-antitoxin system